MRHDPRPPRTISGASRLSQLAPAGVVEELSPRVQGAYLRARLIAEAASPTLEELLDRVGERTRGDLSLEVAVAVLREDRDRR